MKNSVFPIPAEPLKYDTYAEFPIELPDGTLVEDLSTDALYTYDLTTKTYKEVSPDLTGFVPYTGATGAVNLGVNPITAGNLSGTNTGDQVGDGVTVGGAGTVLSPFEATLTIPISKTLSYNIDGTLNVVTDTRGTKTMGYNPDGTLASLTGTGVYKTKTFTYSSGVLTGVTVV